MTTPTGLFQPKQSQLVVDYPYVEVAQVEVQPSTGSATSVVLRSISGDSRACQGCTDHEAIRSFVDRLQLQGVPVHTREAIATWQPARSGEIKVKSYKNEGEFQRDAERMLAAGWEFEGQSAKAQKTAIGRTAGKVALTGGIALIVMGRSKKGDTITVTWRR